MSDNLNITCIQADLAWENASENRNTFTSIFSTISTSSDIVILPEMFTTGFSMKPENLAETMDGESLKWMKEQSARLNKLIIGSIIIKENNQYFNRLIVMFPNGSFEFYDKRHLFRMGKEHEHYAQGNKRLVFKHNGWRICTLICYDLRFPVWSRNRNDYDLLIYVANWPESRREVWKSLLVARALENQSYVVGVNRVGNDGEGLSYAGDTVIISPKGQIIATAKEKENDVIHAKLSLQELKDFREKFPAYLDADDFEIL